MLIERSGVVLLAILLSACGTNITQRAATGGLTGAGVGAVVGGPIGAIIGAASGAVGGALIPKSADDMAADALHEMKTASTPPRGTAQAGSSMPAPRNARNVSRPSSPQALEPASLKISKDLARHIQQVLKDEGLYHASIDGIVGPQTQTALASFQSNHGAAPSSTIDLATMQMLVGQESGSGGSEAAPTSGDAPPAPEQAPDAGDPNTQDDAPNGADAPTPRGTR